MKAPRIGPGTSWHSRHATALYLRLHLQILDWECLETFSVSNYLQLFFLRSADCFEVPQWPRKKRNSTVV